MSHTYSFVRPVLVAFTVLVTSACGGGGGGGGGGSSNPAPAPVVPTVSVANAAIDEGNSGNAAVNVGVALSQSTTSTVSVNFATADGTARSGADYQATSGTLTFAPGETAKTITIQVIGNSRFEAEKTFSVTLSSPSGATLGSASATVTIRNDDEEIASIDLSPSQLVLFVNDRRTVTATPRASSGAALTNRTGSWTSGNPSVATVSTTGEVAAIAIGSTTVRITMEGKTADVMVTVTPAAATYLDYKAHFPFRVASGRFIVASDISMAFSQQHLDHLLKVWQYFSAVYARTPGQYTEMYYTRDLNGLYSRILQTCPTIVIPGGRNLTACFDSADGVYIWFVVPYTEPDFGTQLHEVGHTFLYFTQFNSANWPWFNEGISMYWESGSFSAAGTFSVERPLPYLTSNFRRVANANALVPLDTLLQMTRDQFYGDSDPARVYSQAGMVLYYLFKQYPSVAQGLIEQINSSQLSTNAAVINYILQQTGLTAGQLEANVRQYALSFP